VLALLEAASQQHSVETVGPDALSETLSGMGALFGDPPLYYCETTSSKLDVATLERQAQAKDGTVLLLWLDGKVDERTALAKFLKKLPSDSCTLYNLSPEYKRADEALSFLIDQACTRKLKIHTELCKAIIERVGPDFGVLHFEMEKLEHLCHAENTTEITVSLVSRSLAALGDVSPDHLYDAILSLNSKNLHKVLSRIKKMSSNTAPSVKEFSGRLQGRLILAVQAANFRDRGVDSKSAALQLGQNAWYYENKILAPLSKFSEKFLVSLLLHFAQSDRMVMLGAQDPWVYFETGLFRLLKEFRGK